MVLAMQGAGRGRRSPRRRRSAVISVTPTDWSPQSFSAGVNPMSFTKFDPALGTLESVNLAIYLKSYTQRRHR